MPVQPPSNRVIRRPDDTRRRSASTCSRLLRLPLTLLIVSQALILVLACALAGWPMPAQAEGAAPAGADQVQWLRDPEGALSPEDAIRLASEGRFRPAADGQLNFGVTRDTIWLRVPLRNDAPHNAERLLEIDYPYLDEVDFYVPADRPGGPLLIRTGDTRLFAARGFDHRNFVLPVSLGPGETTEVFVRVRSSAAVLVPLQVRSAGEFASLEQMRLLLIGAYYGAALVMVLYVSTLRRALREPAFRAYVAFVFLFALFHFSLNGFAYQYLWPWSPRLSNIGAYLFLSPAVAAATQFSRSFLRSEKRMPRLDRLARALVWILLGLTPAVILVDARWVALLSQALAMIACALGVAMGITAWRAGYRPARWYLLAFATIMVTGAAMVMRNFGLLPRNPLTAYGTQIGAALEVLFLGVALSERLREMVRDALTAKEAALDAAMQAGQQLESRVAERTAELAAANERLRAEVRERERAEALLRSSEERLRRLAQHDPLTGVANRHLLAERAAAIVASAHRQGQRFGVVAVDLDDFKGINDAHGHAIGDHLLAEGARRIAASLRSSDLLARVGGDEFVVLLPGVESREQLHRVVAKLRRVFAQPLQVPGGVIEPQASFGSALFPEDGGDIDALVRHADLAMYRDKESRRELVGPR